MGMKMANIITFICTVPKKTKRFPELVCMLAKILLFIVHICLLVYVINAPFAH
jgi:hypothetical protein